MNTQTFPKRMRAQSQRDFYTPDKLKKIKVDIDRREQLEFIQKMKEEQVNLEEKDVLEKYLIQISQQNQSQVQEMLDENDKQQSNKKNKKDSQKMLNTGSKDQLKSQLANLQQKNKASKQAKKVKSAKYQNQKKSESNGSLQPSVHINKNIIVTRGVQFVPVDNYFPLKDKARVLQINKNFFSVTLTQSNLAKDDNKFFIIQILEVEQDSNNVYYVFSRWGRVGVPGQVKITETPLDLKEAIRQYNTKSQQKVKRGGYKVIEVNYQKETIEDEEIGGYFGQCDLKQKVIELVKLIFDRKMMHSHMKEIGYDQKRSPLGLIAKKSIQKGYIALDKIMKVLKGQVEFLSQSQKRKLLNEYSSQFYSVIPHDFGYVNMQAFVLNTEQKVKQKLQMLSSLSQIQIYSQLMKQKPNEALKCDIDIKYSKLKCKITHVENTSSEAYQTIKRYIKNTHADTHDKYRIQLLGIFQVQRQDEISRYRKELGNKMLLWHGSRLSNYVGILSQGLKIAPLEAPATGYMFGKGIYFADIVSKSSNYCRPKADSEGLMLLCEVALGQTNNKYKADYNAHNLPAGYHSTKGVGKFAPCSGQYHGDVFIPNGQLKPTGIQQTSLLYNEYVIYNRDQVICRYIVHVRFHFK